MKMNGPCCPRALSGCPCECLCYNCQGEFKLQMEQWHVNSIQKKQKLWSRHMFFTFYIKNHFTCNTSITELSHKYCKICITRWNGVVGIQLLISALCFLIRWSDYAHLWNRHNHVSVASPIGLLRWLNVIKYVKVFCEQ